mmetsp:Transcript_128279/g.221592  ORF Transcript_128279/g.221592 Transcript_128279/m.221592 type:complete len:119 (-) Transcript_128279:60-416(-)
MVCRTPKQATIRGCIWLCCLQPLSALLQTKCCAAKASRATSILLICVVCLLQPPPLHQARNPGWLGFHYLSTTGWYLVPSILQPQELLALLDIKPVTWCSEKDTKTTNQEPKSPPVRG